MSVNSPTYQCSSGGTVIANTTDPYCIVPGGHRRMEFCCSDAGSATQPVHFVEDCYTWCNLQLSGQGDNNTQLNNAIDSFRTCLSTGENSTTPRDMVCGGGTSSGSASTPTTVGAAVTMTSSEGTAAPTESSGSHVIQSANAKVVGLTGALLAAGMLVGGGI